VTEPTVRRATPEDAPAIAAVMVASFLATYRGIMPDSVLHRLDLEARTERWRTVLTETEPADPKRVWVVEDVGAVRGYAVTVPANDEFLPPPGGAGELDSLYLHPDAVGLGLGRRLLAHATDDLRERGFDPLVLWAFTANRRARSIYESAGWVHDADHHWVLDEVPVPIVRYRLDRPAGR
jgi:ribosomal protein S18 acetylase RimI-like enzyme